MKVLFFSQDGKLGDAVVNTAFVQAMDGHELHATVSGVTQAFWDLDPRVARTWRVAKPGWRETLQLGLAMRRERFDAIVTWQYLRSEKNKLLLWLARPAQVVDLRAFNAGAPAHKLDAVAAALAALGQAPPASLNYAVRLPAACAELDTLYPAGTELIVVNLFAADAERNISAAEGAALLHGLRALAPQARLALVCTNATEAAARAVAAQGGAADIINCDGNLARLFRLCQRADLTISPDTALVHIVSAYQRPVVAIYQNHATKPIQWAPRSPWCASVIAPNSDNIAGFPLPELLSKAAALRTAFKAS